MIAGAGTIRPLVAGNWKMNGLKTGLSEALSLKEALSGPLSGMAADLMIAPPATLLMVMAEACRGGKLFFAGQDCHANASGAHTGDVSPEMLKDSGAAAVIVGHSERRADHGETDAVIRSKAAAAHRAGLAAIICIGETLGERNAGLTLDVVSRQLKNSVPDGATAVDTVIAYEPVWAIGTGLTPSPADVAQVHGRIRADLIARFGANGETMRILYGGSVKPDNAQTLLAVANVNGALVGGASLKASDFLAIVRAYES
jgi:triosephosphate isomerase (TIM)